MDDKNIDEKKMSYSITVRLILIALRSFIISVLSFAILLPFVLVYSLFYSIIQINFPSIVEIQYILLVLAFFSVFFYLYYYFIWKDDKSSNGGL